MKSKSNRKSKELKKFNNFKHELFKTETIKDICISEFKNFEGIKVLKLDNDEIYENFEEYCLFTREN